MREGSGTEARTLGEWVKEASSSLKQSNVESPKLSAQLILSQVTGLSRNRLIAFSEETITEAIRQQADRLLARRLEHEPVAYLLGRKEFRNLTLEVTPSVLIPRPETEELVDLALEIGRSPHRILDVGTGSGCIPLSLAEPYRTASLFGSDFSLEALRIAQSNDTERRIHWVQSNWLSCFPYSEFDLITSNPPYLTRSEMEELDPCVRDYEPCIALDGGPDGCNCYRELIPEIAVALKPGGTTVLEISPTVEQGVVKIARESGLADIRTHRDLAGRIRFLTASRPTE